jgi:hypothetical protein
MLKVDSKWFRFVPADALHPTTMVILPDSIHQFFLQFPVAIHYVFS